MRVLVTGASGFIGGAVVTHLASDPDVRVRAAFRIRPKAPAAGESVIVGDLGPDTDWASALNGVDVVIHAAARVHVMRDAAADPLSEFRRVNVQGTVALASQAARVGVRRFVFISSIKVNGEQTLPGRPFTPGDVPSPQDPYGVSKREAEDALHVLAKETGMEVTIIRPVLVYGPGVKGNFLSLMRWLNRGVPLPLGAIDNRRSLVALDNLVDLIAVAVKHPAAANEIFLVSDGKDISTTQLLRSVRNALGKSGWLIPVPSGLLRSLAGVAGKGAAASRLFSSLQVDMSRTREILWWHPPVPTDQAIAGTARAFVAASSRGTRF